MRILIVHNRYTRAGGEDVVVEQEMALLRQKGHEVEILATQNEKPTQPSLFQQAGLALNTVWSFKSAQLVKKEIRRFSPDLLHVHNTFTRLSPSIYWAASKCDVPVVQTLHNYRLSCANALLMREHRVCEDCVGKLPLAALRHRCYHNSLAATATTVAMQTTHQWLGTYRQKISAYITLTAFAKSLMIRSGLPAEKIFVKPNFIHDPETTQLKREQKFVFVGRLDLEKGVDLLLEAWRELAPPYQLVIIGDGDERLRLQKVFDLAGVVWKGWLEPKEVLKELAASRFLVLPSRWYEGFPMVFLEAFALGLPVIAPDHGGMVEIVNEEQGFRFQPSSVESLKMTLSKAMQLDELSWQSLHRQARLSYETLYHPEVNYRQLMAIYDFCTSTFEPRASD